MASIHNSVARYEDWLRRQLDGDLVEADLDEKHRKMREAPFLFLRATCWRWAEIAADLCPDLAAAPTTPSTGDAHVGNYGLWRDAEGRLVWGINDYDEAAEIPYGFDLVRLTASALLAGPGRLSAADCARAVLKGYGAGLHDPAAFVLEANHIWLRDDFAASDRKRRTFWAQLAKAPPAKPIARLAAPLAASLPRPGLTVVTAPRRAGVGGLGRPRFVALGALDGGPFAREAKALVPSCWAMDAEAGRLFDLAAGPSRSPDPWLKRTGAVVVRRLAPNSRKLDFEDTRSPRDLLCAMGHELGALHGSDPARAAPIRADLVRRPKRWLREAAEAAAEATLKDWRDYRR